MRRLSGQAARALVALLHHAAHLAILLAVLLGVLLAGAAWRLSRGPVDLSWLTARLEAAMNGPDSPVHLRIGHTALAWEGFRLGVDHPLDLRLTDVSMTDPSGRQQVAIPQAELSLSLGALLTGRMQPRAIELDRPTLLLRRAEDGSLTLDLGPLADTGGPSPGSPLPALLAELARPPASDRTAMRGWISQILRLRIHDASLTVQDRQLGATWQAPDAEIDLTRHPAGGVSGTGSLTLALGEQRARLTLTAALSAGATQTKLTARLTPVRPAALAGVAPVLAPLAAFDAPIGAEVAVRLGADLALQQMRLTLQAGAGEARVDGLSVPVVSASLVADGTPEVATIDSAELVLRGHPGGAPTTLSGSGTVQRSEGRLAASLALNLDSVAFADLPQLWPAAIGRGARDWITQNITDGVARNGHVEVALNAAADLSDVKLASANGTLDGDGVTVHWLRPVPPIENGRAQLRILNPDTLEIAVLGGRQRLRGAGDLVLKDGSMRVTGLMQSHQLGTIQADIAGGLPEALSLLREPRLNLLAKHPMPLANPAGQVSASLAVTVPLEERVQMEDIGIHATARLEHVHLDGVVAGRPLDQGSLDLDATADGLSVKGQAVLAGIPAQLDAAMDFRAGPPGQVLQRVTVSGRPDARQLAAAGLDAGELLSGPVPLQAVLTEQRSGAGTIDVNADLTPAVLALDAVEWRKPAGQAAQVTAQVRLQQDRLQSIPRFSVQGSGVVVDGSAGFAAGKLATLRLDRVELGRSNMRAQVTMPQRAGEPIALSVTGPVLDLSARLMRPRRPEPAVKAEPPPGPPWTLNARFDRVLTANGTFLAPVSVEAENDGRVFRRFYLSGDTGPNAPFDLHIVPDKAGRRLTATAAQAGDLLRALDWLRTMHDGRLSVSATYDDSRADHPLSGTVELSDFRVREAVGLGKLLQAMTLYGLVDALRGSGLVFSQAVLPFRFASGVLNLNEARAFSSSLGLTAQGRVELDAGRIDLQGTIVPAYFFNSLLGKVPVIGKLLSPEKGGGVFAARYTLRGRLDDPDVSVNPLSALTPGILREMFGLF